MGLISPLWLNGQKTSKPVPPVVHYTFDGNGNDSSGNENHAYPQAIDYVEGQIGQAAKFNGYSSYFTVYPKNEQFKNLTDYTFSVWVYLTGWKVHTIQIGDKFSDPTAFIFDGAPNDSDFHHLHGLDKTGFALTLERKMFGKVEMTHHLNYHHKLNKYDKFSESIEYDFLNKWTLITVTRQQGKINHYINGTLVEGYTIDFSHELNEAFAMNHKWYIGNTLNHDPLSMDHTDFGFKGLLDDLRIYDYALSEDEVQALYKHEQTIPKLEQLAEIKIDEPKIDEASPDPKIKIPEKIEATEVSYQEEWSVRKDEVKIEIWDYKKEDGDIITLYLNGEILIDQLQLKNKKHKQKIKLKPGVNTIVMYANNLGSVGNNTAYLKLSDGKNQYEIVLNSDKGVSEAVKVNLE